MESDTLDEDLVFKTRTGQTTTQTAVFKPADDFYGKIHSKNNITW